MAERLTERAALRLQLLAGLAPLLPGLRVFLRIVADLAPPGFAVDDLQSDDRERHCDPSAAVIGDRARGFVETALGLADFLRHVADIGDAGGIELRPVGNRLDDVGA